MSFESFKITSIGSIERDMDPPIAWHRATIVLRNSVTENHNSVEIDIAVPYDGAVDTVDAIELRILDEVKRVLAEAVRELDGCTLGWLYERSDENAKRPISFDPPPTSA